MLSPSTLKIRATSSRAKICLTRPWARTARRKSSETLRRGRVPAEGLALVARDPDGHVIGTVRLWNVEAGVSRDGTPVDALLLGPLAVDAAHEGKGIGGALMRAAIGEAKSRGHGAILLVGDAPLLRAFRLFLPPRHSISSCLARSSAAGFWPSS